MYSSSRDGPLRPIHRPRTERRSSVAVQVFVVRSFAQPSRSTSVTHGSARTGPYKVEILGSGPKSLAPTEQTNHLTLDKTGVGELRDTRRAHSNQPVATSLTATRKASSVKCDGRVPLTTQNRNPIVSPKILRNGAGPRTRTGTAGCLGEPSTSPATTSDKFSERSKRSLDGQRRCCLVLAGLT